MAPSKSRRSFFVELLSTAAGTWITVSGLLGLVSAASGCSDPVEKYGGPPPPDGMVVKYGGPTDGGSERPVTKYGGWDIGSEGPVVKYGGPTDIGRERPATKYGGWDLNPPPWDARPEQPVVKYGGPDMRKEGFTTKYGGPFVG